MLHMQCLCNYVYPAHICVVRLYNLVETPFDSNIMVGLSLCGILDYPNIVADYRQN